MADQADNPANRSTGAGPGGNAPRSDDGQSSTPAPPPDLKSGEIFAESLKNATRRLSELGEEGRETSEALQSLNMMRGKLNAAMKEEIDTKNELIKKHEERVKAEERLSAIQRELTEVDEKYSKMRKEDGTLSHAAQKLYTQDTRKLKEEMLKLNLTVARATSAHREAEQSHSKAVETANKWSENFKANMQAIRGMPGAGKIVKDWLNQLENSFKKAMEAQTEAATEGLTRMESTVEKYSRPRLEAEAEGDEEEAEAQRRASLRRMKSKMEDAAGSAAREIAKMSEEMGTGGVVGVSEIFGAQSVMGDLTESFKKYMGRKAEGTELRQFDAMAKMLQTLGEGAAIDDTTAGKLAARIQAQTGTEFSAEMMEILKKSLEETKKLRESDANSSGQVVIAIGKNNDIIDTVQKTITDNTRETINLLKQEEVNKLLEQGIDTQQAREIVERRSETKGTQLQLAIAREQKKSLEAIKTATNETGNRTIDALIVNADQMSEDQRLSIEAAVEQRFIVPKWAGMLISAYEESIGVFVNEFNRLTDLFDGSTGTTKVLMYAAIGIGIVVGYIWTYLQKVMAIFQSVGSGISKIPIIGSFLGGFGARVSSFFTLAGGKILSMFKLLFVDMAKFFINGAKGVLGIFSRVPMLGGLLTSIMGGLKSSMGIFNVFKGGGSIMAGLTQLGNVIPFVGRFLGFVPKIMGAFQLGLKVGSALFPPLFAIINIVTAIVGAFRGFGQGGLKGAILGAIAQVLAGFTFGLINFQQMFDFLNSTIGPIVETIANTIKFLYTGLLKPIIDMMKNISAIWKGGGGIFTKILKTLGELVFAYVKVWIASLITVFLRLPILILKAFFHIVKFFVYDIPKLLIDAVAWFWNWIVSGDWISDIGKFGEWAGNKLKELWEWALNGIADAFAELPWVGEHIAAMIRPTSKENAEVLEEKIIQPIADAIETTETIQASAIENQAAFADDFSGYYEKPDGYGQDNVTIERFVDSDLGIDRTIMTRNGVPIQPSSATNMAEMERARVMAERASSQKTKSGNVQINNNQFGGGGGSQSLPPIPMPISRNNDPTYRALLFMEAPAL